MSAHGLNRAGSMFIDPYEMTKMVNLWDGHRSGAAPCTHRGDLQLCKQFVKMY